MRLGVIDGGRGGALILTVFEDDGLRVGMGVEEAEELGAGVAGEADEADLIFIHRCE
jgi:hypothetical protein